LGSQDIAEDGTADTRIIISNVKRTTDADAIRTAIEPVFEGTLYAPLMITQTDFVNITTSLGPAQTGGGAPDAIPPAQVTGLVVTPTGSSTLGLAWTANGEPDLNHYNVYRGTVNGFTVTLGVTVPVGTPTTNSYGDSGLSASTTYYYRVSAVDHSANIGPLSTQAQGTTLAPGAIVPQLELHLDSTFAETSGNNHPIFGTSNNGFFTPGKFGTAAWRCNTPTAPTIQPDVLFPGGATIPQEDVVPLEMDTSIGFSISCWVFPVDLSALSFRRQIAGKAEDIDNKWTIQVDSAGIVYLFVKKAGIDYKRQISGFTTGSWQHIGATFNGATNTVAVYRNAVAGIASTATAEWPSQTQDWFCIGARPSGTGGDGALMTTYYVGYFDEFRYYKSAVLTPTQVTNLMNTNAP
jgi:hypothetical protein